MRETWNEYREKLRRDRKKQLLMRMSVSLCAFLVAGVVLWALILPGVALTGEAKCGIEEHTHTEECYTETLTCGQEESVGHTHSDSCYTEQTNLICGQEESADHTHTDECYETEYVLTCGQEESAGHTHTDECYTEELTCGKEEHTHTDSCYIDTTADVEDASTWEATFADVTLGDDWNENVLAIAKTQIGYTESTDNYSIGDNEEHNGYTRYGAWAGDVYADWNTLFAQFCFSYAEVPDNIFPTNADIDTWIEDMKDCEWYADSTSTDYQTGDIVFLQKADQETEKQVGIISEIYEENGTTYIKVIEGNSGNAVAENTYEAGSSDIIGYGLLSLAQDTYEEALQSYKNSGDESTDDSEEVYETDSNSEIMLLDAGTAIDFKDYITSIKTEKSENGVWQSTSTFKDGDTIRATLSYTIPEDILSSAQKVIQYQLPEGIAPSTEQTGYVYDDNDKPQGTYVITTDGLITITFYDEYVASRDSIVGTIQFSGTVSNDSSENDKTIEFDGTGTTITITKKRQRKT